MDKKSRTSNKSAKTIKLNREEERKNAEAHLKEVMLRYSLPTFVGNWLENKFVKEMKDEMLEEQKAFGETVPQKQELITTRLEKPLTLASFYGYIPFNAPIQIVKSNMENMMSSKLKNNSLSILSTIITDKQLKNRNVLEIDDACPIIISSDRSPKRPNVFCFVNTYPNNKGNAILYDQSIMICLQDSLKTTPLYLRCENPTHDSFGVSNDYLPVTLSSVPDRFCKFKLEKSIPDNQIKFFPTDPVSSNDVFNITHICSNRTLVISSNTITNYLGRKEKTVACKQDVYRDNVEEKIWNIIFKPQDSEKTTQ